MCSYANHETVVKVLGIYNAGNEQQTEVKYIGVKFVVDDDEMVPFPEFFEDIQSIQSLLHADFLYSTAVLQGNRSIYTIVRNIIAWYVDKAPPSVDEPEGRNMRRTKERDHRLFGPLQSSFTASKSPKLARRS
jgi:hypothetical protein